jgi:hypothetical protein
MPINIYSDRERLEKWNDICIAKNWSKPGELQLWLGTHNIKFTSGDSVLAPEGLVLRVNAPDAARGLVIGAPGETMATHVLSVYTGLITFTSTHIESLFWKEVIERMDREFDIFVPPELVPAYVRDILKYPSDGEGELPT